ENIMAKGGKGGGGSGGGKGGGTTAPKGTRKDDNLIGTDGDDTILAGGGDDTVDGAGGNDFLSGDAGQDILFGNVGNDRLFGGGDDDILSGGDGSDELFGGLGDDTLYGDDGADYLQANEGSDIMDGGAGYDIASFEDVFGGIDDIGVVVDASFDGTATTYTATNLFSISRTDIDTLTGIEEVRGSNWNDVMTGADGDDYFVGALGDDTLDGAGGNDTLYGSVGNDLLTGGPGSDQFVFFRQADGISEPRPGDPPDFDPADPGYGDGDDIITDFDLTDDWLIFFSNEDTELSVSTDGTDTMITYGSASSIVLEGVVASEADLNILTETDAGFDFSF
ncbi:MAG: hypothetical protein KJN60_03070, partial [Boseongicola sp.]|nr:hypothetical protein [Boseongicola sp.]